MQDPFATTVLSYCQNQGALDARIVGNYPLDANRRMVAIKAQWDKASFLEPGAIRIFVIGTNENLDIYIDPYSLGVPIAEEDLPSLAESLKSR